MVVTGKMTKIPLGFKACIQNHSRTKAPELQWSHYSDRYLTLTFGMKDKTYKVHQTTQYSARHFVE